MSKNPARLVLASNNQGKLRELEALFEPLGVALVTQGALGIDAAEENGATFIENAVRRPPWPACDAKRERFVHRLHRIDIVLDSVR